MDIQNKYHPVNWTDGMKLNKDTFIAQDKAHAQALSNAIATNLSPIRFGLLPVANNFNVQISVDNQNVVQASIINLHAITKGGFLIAVNYENKPLSADGNPASTLQINAGNTDTVYWVIAMAKPYDRIPMGQPDPDENPIRLPYINSGIEVIITENSNFSNYVSHPYALTIGKISVKGSNIKVDADYLPPSISTSASDDLLGLHAELDSFLSGVEASCALIVQKILRKSQQNDLSELAQFLCDRVMLFIGQSLTDFRWSVIHESPAKMLSYIAGLARVIKNTVDLRLGSGKEELLTYLGEWVELTPGEFENLLSSMAAIRYNHNDVNENITQVIDFAKVIGKLFNTLSNLEFIGKKKESGLFVKEETNPSASNIELSKPKRRFFG